ncbi:hypothetical protein QTP70_022740 [Hemibagrus guttatus]|uniref:ribonuclease H n=1 Tax=Hemibagrus guttatus TaxID=175788 RepID=A0AAE0QNG1_9TELE|nr:hypothetical protein QTP70_022740 [Hemibagrus guttatus]
MAVVNTYFQKREEHRVTYKSGGRRTQVDYILCRRGNLKEISDCKVVVGETVARQHRMVVCRMTLLVCKTKRSKIEIEKKTKWWKLKKEECCEEFRQKLRQALGGQVVLPDDWETTVEVIRETGRKVLGVSSGRRKEDKETWWWNEEVQDSIQRKRLAKKKWDMDRTEENRQEYKELQHRVKREVSKAKQKAYNELYTRLDTREGEKDLYRLARQRDRDGKDVQQVRVIKDRDGRVLTSEESVQRRWKEYFEELMNEENEREKRVEGVNSVEQKVDKIRKDEVRKALKRMKSGKAVGPDDIPVEVWKCLGEAAVEFLTSLFNRVLESEKMPEEWRRSVLVPIFKNKGDVQSCSNYRGIKLMSHTMKLWERVMEARLRKVVEICEQQYGFMPRKSTTDAIFALRILMEKYRDGHCVFVVLEKAYDRVPREELWYCMRKSGVAEKYVRVVQDMYERSRTVVRCAVGQTEEFKVKVGLHQGSALSPFLFAIVMDQLSEEVRQESPWTMMFADDIVICSESREKVEESLERWRFVLERRGMKVSRSKTEYMCVNEREGSGTVRLQGEEVKKVQEFKYLGSTVQSNGECGKEFVCVESLVTAIVDMHPSVFRRKNRRELLILAVACLSFLMGLIMLTEGGMYVFQLFDYYAASGMCLLFVGIFETICIAWIYGADRFYDNIEDMIGYRPGPYIKYCWLFLTPATCFGTFAFSLIKYTPLKYNNEYVYPWWGYTLGWLLALSSMVCIPLWIVYKMCTSKGTIRERFHELTTPSPDLPITRQEQEKLQVVYAADGEVLPQRRASTKDGYFPVSEKESQC